MDKTVYYILVATEHIHRLMEELVAMQRECRQRCAVVELPPPPTVPSVSSGAVAPRLIPQPDPMAGQPDLVLMPGYAAQLLGRSDRQLSRYRAEGKLDYVEEDGEGRSGYWLSQLRRLYFDIWGKWPPSGL